MLTLLFFPVSVATVVVSGILLVATTASNECKGGNINTM